MIDRAAQPYVALRGVATVATLASIADRIPGLFAWLAERDLTPAGDPFFRYRWRGRTEPVEFVVEAGVPVAHPVAGADDVLAGELPVGRYLEFVHRGGYDGLDAAVTIALAHAEATGLRIDATRDPDGTRWGCRLDDLRAGPATEPRPERWETGLLFLLADS